ncbi:MAG: PAS domain-containing sensor histidine kinase [Succinivibrio sp.]|nr:PAS domain-containing sensor histidine kinase [Succinivibrio sp.]
MSDKNQQSSQDLMFEVFEKVPSAIIVLDSRGIIKKANQSALSMLGMDELEGHKWYEIIEKVFAPKRDDGNEISTRDGKRLQVSTKPLSCGQLVQMTDLTHTRELQDKLSHMERLSSLGRMAASLAHQIRTPLSAAILYAANLGNSRLPPASRINFQKKLMSRLEALESQVSDILLYARSGEQTVTKMDAVDLIESVSSNVVSVLTRANAELETAIGDRPMPILGNAQALNGALSNLIANAIEAGATKVRLELKTLQDSICFFVADNGPGIPQNIRKKIFEPFYTTKSNGTGLGLAVVAAVAKVHQGRVDLLSSKEYPTIFSITIPKYERENAPSQSIINNKQTSAA